ncbi:hypothetical protein [Aureliella helgolandensis]|uniref:Uncharacterized protein n=1 Tax=Aureliella helgolandensis TaxID=2527968 RepID=A0A518GFY5_9BACT|nr:hypothetical protein [Aureliella helgolandensis]QDV27458.1 hypothetical protein Q31a_58470 [Aureliella helgolandensis]
MWDLLNQPAVRASLAVLIMLTCIYLGWRAALALRPLTGKDDTNVDDLVRNFEEMRLEGDIDETELRSIRSVLEKTEGRRLSE